MRSMRQERPQEKKDNVNYENKTPLATTYRTPHAHLLLQIPNDRIHRIPRDNLRVVQHVKLLRRVPTCVQ